MFPFTGKHPAPSGIYRSVPFFTGRHVARLLAAALTLAAASVAAWSPTAAAKIYGVQFCSDASTVSTLDLNLLFTPSCNSFRTLTQQVADAPPNVLTRPVTGSKGWTLAAPFGTTIVQLGYTRHLFGFWSADDVKWELRLTSMLGGDDSEVLEQFTSRNGGFSDLPGDTSHTITFLQPVSQVWSLLGCLHPASNPCSQNATDVFGVELSNLTALLDDVLPPTAVLSSLPPGAVSGIQTLISNEGDEGSGLKSAILTIDGQVANEQDDTSSTCSTSAYKVVRPCALGPASRFSVDTTQLSEGTHTAQVTVADAARNSSSSNAISFTVRNTPASSAPPTLTGSAVIGAPLNTTIGKWDDNATAFNFRWLRCPATVTASTGAASCTPILGALDAHVYTPTSDDAGHRIIVQITARNALAPKTSPVTVASAPSAIVPALPGPPQIGPPPGSDHTPPTLSAISLSHTRFRAVTKGSASLLRLTTSEAAKLTITIQRALPGKQVKHGRKVTCTAVRKPVKHGRCTIYKTATTLTNAIKTGHATIALTGRAGKKKLAPGTYRITLVARDAAGNTSAAKRLTFTILAG